MSKFNINYFINKFSKIDDEDCITGTICKGGAGEPLKYDCLGHCKDDKGKYNLRERDALRNLGNVVSVWDGHESHFTQPTPRLRLLAYLKHLKNS